MFIRNSAVTFIAEIVKSFCKRCPILRGYLSSMLSQHVLIASSQNISFLSNFHHERHMLMSSGIVFGQWTWLYITACLCEPPLLSMQRPWTPLCQTQGSGPSNSSAFNTKSCAACSILTFRSSRWSFSYKPNKSPLVIICSNSGYIICFVISIQLISFPPPLSFRKHKCSIVNSKACILWRISDPLRNSKPSGV
jgi:hypothetical protein